MTGERVAVALFASVALVGQMRAGTLPRLGPRMPDMADLTGKLAGELTGIVMPIRAGPLGARQLKRAVSTCGCPCVLVLVRRVNLREATVTKRRSQY